MAVGLLKYRNVSAPLQENTTEASTAYDVALWDTFWHIMYRHVKNVGFLMCVGRLGNVKSLARTEDKCNSNSATKRWKREPGTMKPHHLCSGSYSSG